MSLIKKFEGEDRQTQINYQNLIKQTENNAKMNNAFNLKTN